MDFARSMEISFNDFRCGLSWAWIGDWKVEVSPKTDPDGWTYGEDIAACLHQTPSKSHKARKRLWLRKCYKLFD